MAWMILCDVLQHLMGIWVGLRLLGWSVWIVDDAGPAVGHLAYNVVIRHIDW